MKSFRNQMFFLFLFSVIVVSTLISCSKLSSDKQSKIISDTRPLIESCKTLPESIPIEIKGKVLVWGMENNGRSRVQSLIPSALEATDEDNQVTVFFIWPLRDVCVGYYSISHQPGYVRYVDISAVYWPQKQAAGFHSIASNRPVQSRVVSQFPEYGDFTGPIAQWIETLPRDKQTTPKN